MIASGLLFQTPQTRVAKGCWVIQSLFRENSGAGLETAALLCRNSLSISPCRYSFTLYLIAFIAFTWLKIPVKPDETSPSDG